MVSNSMKASVAMHESFLHNRQTKAYANMFHWSSLEFINITSQDSFHTVNMVLIVRFSISDIIRIRSVCKLWLKSTIVCTYTDKTMLTGSKPK